MAERSSSITILVTALLASLLVASACSSSDGPSQAASETSVPSPATTAADPTAPDSTAPHETNAESTVPPEDSAIPSIRSPEVLGVSSNTLLSQNERAALGGQNTYYWPDGTIGTLTASDGSTRFFAANGPVSAQTVGALLDPGDALVTAGQPIRGISDEFSYAAGGPVYRDEATGMILLWYHAERHLEGDAANFHAAIGLARSLDDGASFENLGIIIEPNAEPDPDAPCCVDVGGAPVIMRDGMFHLWFRDRIGGAAPVDIQLARASARVDDVVAAALEGDVVPWSKQGASGPTDGLGGRPIPLELGNLKTSWFDVAWHDGFQRYLMVIATHGGLADASRLELTSSSDGLSWTPRQPLVTCDCELTYPSFLGTSGPERTVGNDLSIVFVVTSPTADFRWQDTSLQLATVELSGELVTGPTMWTFDEDDDGWTAGGTVAASALEDGALRLEADGADPFLTRAGFGLSADEFSSVRIVMASEMAGTGQIFFTTDRQPGIDEDRSVRFEVEATPAGSPPQEYVVEMGAVPGWGGLLDTLRIDPVDQNTTISIDLIELLPAG